VRFRTAAELGGDPPAVGLMPDYHDRRTTSLHQLEHRLGCRAGREPLVRLDRHGESPAELRSGLPRAEERARQQRVGPHVVGGQLRSERASRLATSGRQRPQLVGLAWSGLRVPDENELHAAEDRGLSRLGRVPKLRYVLADVFTDTPLAGNALAVFTDGRGLETEQMQRLAREMNLSETVFVFPAEGDGHARIRIFTPGTELPFAGHPTLGTAFVLAGPLQLSVIKLETNAGVVPVTLEREGSRIVFGRMEQPLPTWEPFAEEATLLGALGLEQSALPVELYDNGMRNVYVALGSEEEVAALRPDFSALSDFPPVLGTYCFAGSGPRWKGRMFAPAGGVAEDPATGSAVGPLAVHLARHGRIRFGEEVEISQGAEIGRPSTLHARVDGSAAAIERVEVGGSAVVVARGEFGLP
jgi:trans-2,3-dihydro-3-hydroxyanthranilate isomerase